MKEKKESTALMLIALINSCIKEAGSKGIPSGSLYSMLLGRISLDTYQNIITLLKHAGKVKESNYILTSL